MKNKYSFEEVSARLKTAHAGKLSIVKSSFTGMSKPCIVKCNVCGYKWSPSLHHVISDKSGCPSCSGKRRDFTVEDILKRIKGVHKTKIKMFKDSYKSVAKNAKFKCNECGHVWSNTVNNVLKGQGCNICSRKKAGKRRRYSVEKVQELINEKHGKNIFKLIKSSYTFVNSKANFYCVKGNHKFKSTPRNLIAGHGCLKCKRIEQSKRQTMTKEQYVQRLQDLYGNKLRLIGEYKGPYMYTDHACNKDHVWEAKPIEIRNGRGGCRVCSLAGFSKISQQWLKGLEKKYGIKIQMASKGGEKHIVGKSGKVYKVDGFCKATNTVYEFYGDAFHGNPKLFKPKQKCDPFSNCTAGKLYRDTISREQDMRKAGYKLKVMWEHDYKKIM